MASQCAFYGESDLPHYTYKDYVHWDGRWELLDAIAFAMTPVPTVEQQRVSQKIARLLEDALENCEACVALLPVDWKITEDTIVQTDNLAVCYQPTGSYLTKAPALIFEVLSPSSRSKDENIKFRRYQAECVLYYCLVDPDEKLIKIFD